MLTDTCFCSRLFKKNDFFDILKNCRLVHEKPLLLNVAQSLIYMYLGKRSSNPRVVSNYTHHCAREWHVIIQNCYMDNIGIFWTPLWHINGWLVWADDAFWVSSDKIKCILLESRQATTLPILLTSALPCQTIWNYDLFGANILRFQWLALIWNMRK